MHAGCKSNINWFITIFRTMNSLGSRVAGTVVVGVCWLAFFLLFLAFFIGSFDFWQNIAIFIVSLIVAGGIIAVMWIRWVLR